jgi:DNA-binding transcriptional LysR family regulator
VLPPINEPALESVSILREPLIAALPAKHPLARQRGKIALEKLREAPFILFPRPLCARSLRRSAQLLQGGRIQSPGGTGSDPDADHCQPRLSGTGGRPHSRLSDQLAAYLESPTNICKAARLSRRSILPGGVATICRYCASSSTWPRRTAIAGAWHAGKRPRHERCHAHAPRALGIPGGRVGDIGLGEAC